MSRKGLSRKLTAAAACVCALGGLALWARCFTEARIELAVLDFSAGGLCILGGAMFGFLGLTEDHGRTAPPALREAADAPRDSTTGETRQGRAGGSAT